MQIESTKFVWYNETYQRERKENKMCRIEKVDEKQNYINYVVSDDTESKLKTSVVVCKGTYNLQNRLFDKSCYFKNLKDESDVLNAFIEYGVIHIHADEHSCVTISCGNVEWLMKMNETDKDMVRKMFAPIFAVAMLMTKRHCVA